MNPVAIIDSLDIRTRLAAVALHVSADTTRAHLAGVLVEFDGVNMVRFVATNGHTLACVTFQVETAPSMPFRTLLRANTVKDIVADAKANKVARYGFTARQVNGPSQSWLCNEDGAAEFPPYRQVIPQVNGSKPCVFSIAARYVALTAKTFETAYQGKNKNATGVAMRSSGGELDAILCASFNVPGLVVVVMPLREGTEKACFEVPFMGSRTAVAS